MKKTFLFILILSSLFFKGISQCDNKDRVFQCAKLLGDSITYLNDFEINQDKRKSADDPNGEVWDIYLMRGTEYRFALCCPAGIDDKIMRLFNVSSTEENPILTTGMQKKSNFYFDFICKKSGVYKVSIRFKQENLLGKELSATGLLGFIRKVNNY